MDNFRFGSVTWLRSTAQTAQLVVVHEGSDKVGMSTLLSMTSFADRPGLHGQFELRSQLLLAPGQPWPDPCGPGSSWPRATGQLVWPDPRGPGPRASKSRLVRPGPARGQYIGVMGTFYMFLQHDSEPRSKVRLMNRCVYGNPGPRPIG